MSKPIISTANTKYTLTPYERETVVSFNEAENTLFVYTHNYKWKKKILELFHSNPELLTFRHPFPATDSSIQQAVTTSGEYIDVEIANKKLLKLSSPRSGRTMTEEQRIAARERLLAAREKKNEK